jgi:hypothetical protein
VLNAKGGEIKAKATGSTATCEFQNLGEKDFLREKGGALSV